MKKITISLGVLVLVAITYMAYLYATYIDVTIFSGSGYGFNIGVSKKDAFVEAKEKFKDQVVYIIHPKDSYGAGPFKIISFADDDKLILFKMDTWKIYYDTSVWDSIELTFEKDKLFSVYRRRQNFELP